MQIRNFRSKRVYTLNIFRFCVIFAASTVILVIPVIRITLHVLETLETLDTLATLMFCD